jgi:hypothetical protein
MKPTMKTPKSTSGNPANPSKEFGLDPSNLDNVIECRRILREHKPTPAQLAQIAAPLLPHHKDNYGVAIIEAAYLLAICESEIKEAENLNLIDQMDFNPFGVEIPRPKEFPISFEQMLRLLMPGTDKAVNRLAKFRDFIREHLVGWAKGYYGSKGDGKDDWTRGNDWITEVRKRDDEAQKGCLPGSIDDSQYFYWASAFVLWERKKRSERGRINASKRKPKPKKNKKKARLRS